MPAAPLRGVDVPTLKPRLSDSDARRAQWTPGPGTMMGKDHTIFAVEDGVVKFDRSSVRARICVVAEEEYVPTKDTARARKFAKCVAAL